MSRLRLVVLGLILVLLATSGSAEARKKKPPPSPTKRVATAQTLVRKLSRTSWAKGRRTAVLNVLAKAGRDAKHVRRCTAARDIDRARNAMSAKKTWKKKAVPKTVRKRILPGLVAAEKSLLKKAGKRCAKPLKRSKKVKHHRGGRGFKPVLGHDTKENDQGEDEGDDRAPVGKYRPIKKKGKSLGISIGPRAAQARAAIEPGRSLAAGPLTFFTSSDLGVPPLTGSPKTNKEPQEPTTAVGHNVAWFTGNTAVGFSLNGGTSWTTMDPSTILPDPAGQPLCCDQLVTYSPQENLFVWLMQYWCSPGSSKPASNNCKTGGTGGNRIRIAVASPEDIRKNSTNVGAAWTYWDFPPTSFGLAANAWFDRSDISVNASFLNWTVDIIRDPGTASSLMARIPLSQLKARGSVSTSYATDTIARMTAAQGTGTSTSYFAGEASTTQTRLWEWGASSGQLFQHDIDHDSIPINNGAANGSDGADWYARWGIFPAAVESVVWTGNQLIVSQGAGRDQCTKNCNGKGTPETTHVFDHPAIYISRFDTNEWKLSSQRWLWFKDTNVGWPFLAVSGDGTVGITFVAADDNKNPAPVAGFLNEESFVLALGGAQPQSGGDYYSLRPGRTASSFVIPARTNEVDPDGVTRTHWRYIEYGHGTPPSANAPSVFITSPQENRVFNTGAPIAFNATVSDPEDGIVPDRFIVWRVDGAQIGTGSARRATRPAPPEPTPRP